MKLNRKYYEVFGDLESQVEHLKLLTLLLAAILVLVLVGAFFLARKPGVVIRVSEVGQAEAIQDLELHNAPTEPEILYFAKTFTVRYTAYNAYTLARDTAEALNMMAPKLAKRARRMLLESGQLSRIKEANLHVDIEFKEETVERKDASHTLVSLIGVRTIRSYDNPDFKESNLFKAELVLERAPRTKDTPQGLLVAEYGDLILNRLEGGNR